jgi:hypothetical protein
MFMGGSFDQWIGVIEWFIGTVMIFITICFISDLLVTEYFTDNKADCKKIHKNKVKTKKIFHDVA